MRVLVELDRLAQGWVFLQQVEEGRLFIIAAVALADGLDDGAGINVLMDTERDGGDVKGGMLCFTSPNKLWVKVRELMQLNTSNQWNLYLCPGAAGPGRGRI